MTPPFARLRVRLNIVALVLVVLLAGCDEPETSILERERLFTLDIGRLEDELDLFVVDGVLPRHPTSLAMRDGFITISNGPANKILEFTSFGDLVRIIYHPVENAPPVTLAPGSTPGARVTRVAVPYSFGRVGHVAVDSRRVIYAEDQLPTERALFDTELGVSLNRIVLRFGPDTIEYFGQEGVGGTPFPFIDRIDTTLHDDVAVVASAPDRRIVTFFADDGSRIATVRIPLAQLPVPDDSGDWIAVLDTVVPGIDAYRVYLKVSYYRRAVAEDTGREYGIGFDHARIYWIDILSESYTGFVELPREIAGAPVHFDLVGIARDEHLFLVTASPDAPQLLIMNDEGRVVRRRAIDVPSTATVVRSYHVNADGVLTLLAGSNTDADVFWWRSDRLIPGAPR